MTEKLTEKKRGFGFVTFTSSDAVRDCLSQAHHLVDDKTVGYSVKYFFRVTHAQMK